METVEEAMQAAMVVIKRDKIGSAHTMYITFSAETPEVYKAFNSIYTLL